MLIGELATAAGISRDTLRFYEQQRLIRARRLDNGYRDYPAEVLMLVNYIRTAQQLGFTLTEIGRKLPDIWDAADPGPAIAEVLGEKLKEIDARIDALRQLREQLAVRIVMACPLINGQAPAWALPAAR
jgi:MerR family copper efflux transcriptional regulator